MMSKLEYYAGNLVPGDGGKATPPRLSLDDCKLVFCASENIVIGIFWAASMWLFERISIVR